MTCRIATPGLALVLLVGTAYLGVAAPANAASNATMTACSQQYQADKQAGKIPQGVTWSKYYSDCAARMKKGAAATTPAAAKKKAAATTTTAPVKKTKTAKVPTSPNDTPGFVPQEPTGANQAAVATTDAKGKPLSAGEAAFQQRIHECGNEWQRDKAKGTVPAGEKWPQFWSACNTRLKTHG
jgi:phage-related protein